MKRHGDLIKKISNLSNVRLADNHARQNTKSKYEVYVHDSNQDVENVILSEDLENGTYKTSNYKTFSIYEPKERLIFKLPYYPDRIAHHAIMNILKPIWIKTFIHQTYSSIEGRGIHLLKNELFGVLQEHPKETIYCLKMDVHKFYPSINHDILKIQVRKKIKDSKVLALLDEIIDSTDSLTPGVGVPIGNYLSQYFANVYLSEFDHIMKEQWKCKYYFRYADDMVVLSDNKEWLHSILAKIKNYFEINLKLELKPNYQIFPIESRGIDFVGYVFKHSHVLLRKSIKKKLNKLVLKYQNKKIDKESFKKSLMSYKGWMQHCNAIHLANTIYDKTKIRVFIWNGKKVNISSFYNKYIWVIRLTRHKKFFELYFKYKGIKYVAKSRNWLLYNKIKFRKHPFHFKYDRNKFKLTSLEDLETGK